MDSPAIDLQQFTDLPFVIERPAEPSILADFATTLLAKRGMRMSFGGQKEIANAVVLELASDVPAGFAVLDRQTAKVVSSASTPATTIIASLSRPCNVRHSPNQREAMLLEGYRLTGYGLLGSDREEIAVFAAMKGVQKGFRAKSLSFFTEAQAHWEEISPKNGLTSHTLRDLLAERHRMSASVMFASYSPDELAQVARRFANDVGSTGKAIRQRDNNAFSSPDELSIRPQIASLPPFPSIDDAKFPVKAWGSAPSGPAYLSSDKFNDTSRHMAQGVHPDLLKVINRAQEISKVRFEIVPTTGGVRDEATQERLKAKGHSHAKLGRHTIGYALDLVPVNEKGRIDFGNLKGFEQIRNAMEQAANEVGVPIQWGGNWKKLVDKPHFELDRKVYPGPDEEPDAGVVMTAFR